MTEILKELSKKTLADYTDKAANDMIKSDQAGKKSKADKRFNGLIKAGDKINAKTRSSIKEDHKMKTLKEILQLDELSKNTLKSYAKAASGTSHDNSAPNLASRAGHELGQDYGKGKFASNAGEKDDKKAVKRAKFVHNAIDRLTK